MIGLQLAVGTLILEISVMLRGYAEMLVIRIVSDIIPLSPQGCSIVERRDKVFSQYSGSIYMASFPRALITS